VWREKWLYLDVRQPGAWNAQWRDSRIVISKFDVPSDKAGATARIKEAWERDGSHRAYSDLKSDTAVVLVDARTPREVIANAVAALEGPTRERKSTPEGAVVPVFQVRVASDDDPALKRKRWLAPDPDHYTGPDPDVRFQAPVVSGRLTIATVAATVETNHDRVRRCYRSALERNPKLAGMIAVRFVIDSEGAVHIPSNGGSDLVDQSLVTCITNSFGELSFPAPEGGIVTVIARMDLASGNKGVR
jgi:hypothetical protein